MPKMLNFNVSIYIFLFNTVSYQIEVCFIHLFGKHSNSSFDIHMKKHKNTSFLNRGRSLNLVALFFLNSFEFSQFHPRLQHPTFEWVCQNEFRFDVKFSKWRLNPLNWLLIHVFRICQSCQFDGGKFHNQACQKHPRVDHNWQQMWPEIVKQIDFTKFVNKQLKNVNKL